MCQCVRVSRPDRLGSPPDLGELQHWRKYFNKRNVPVRMSVRMSISVLRPSTPDEKESVTCIVLAIRKGPGSS